MRTIAVDVGNTRIKWGRCSTDQIEVVLSLDPDSESEWADAWDHWQLSTDDQWILASVHHRRADRFADWLTGRGAIVFRIANVHDIPLTVDVARPEGVGIDRLLNAVALTGNAPAVIVDVGTAVTVDWLDEAGIFRGGAILPGFRLMAEALHGHTAALPLVPASRLQVPPHAQPGRDTETAIETGIFWAIVGAVRSLAAGYTEETPAPIYLTGGDAPLLREALGPDVRSRPELTLEGIRRCAGGRDE